MKNIFSLIVIIGLTLTNFIARSQCQQINAVLDSLSTTPQPHHKYIDIFSGGTVIFEAVGFGSDVFPENGIYYTQDPSTSLFIWDFSDGTSDTGQIVNKTFNFVKGYDITLTVKDILNCSSATTLVAKVRVSRSPIVDVNPPPDMCTPDTVLFSVGRNVNSTVVVVPLNVENNTNLGNNIPVFIPDGPNCSVQCLEAPLMISGFPNNMYINNINDIKAINTKMEHSFAGDLGVRIICPNGQYVQLDPNTHSGGAYLGVPFGGADHNLYDNGCDPANNTSGNGWSYCWSMIYPQHGTLDALSNAGGTADSTNTLTHTNYLTPNNSFNGLIGCPFNGEWILEICDDYAVDNGYLFNWHIDFAQTLTSNWSYNIAIDSVIWSGNNISPVNDSAVQVIFNNAGIFNYTVTLIDELGFSFDTNFAVNIVATPNISLGSDTTLCLSNLLLDPGTGEHYSWSTGGGDTTITVNTSGDYSVTVTNFNLNHTLGCPSKDTISVNFSTPPALNICFVEFDSASQKNKVIWNSNLSANVERVHIYKEVSLNTWNYIGDVAASTGYFIDVFSNPSSQSYSYKIASYDTCNNEGVQSFHHTTITLLSAYDQQSNTYGFTWSSYIGIPVPNYKLYGVDVAGAYHLIGSVPGNQYFYNYMNPSSAYIKYFVGFDAPICSAKSTTYLVKSNWIQSYVITGIEGKTDNDIQIFPNPVSNELTLETKGNNETINFEIYNSIGQIVYKSSFINKTIVQTTNLESGIYMIKLGNGKTFEFKKIVKE